MFFRTDMAVERREVFKVANNLKQEIDGIETEEESINDTKITRVLITNKNGERALRRKKGTYITIDAKKINNISVEKERELIKIFSDELKDLIDKHASKNDEILIVGLGNLNATPDSLGAKVVDNIEITRHIKMFLPNAIDKNTRSVSAVVPRSTWNNRD